MNRNDIELIVMAYNRSHHTLSVLNALEKEKVNSITLYLDAPTNEFDEKEQNTIKRQLGAYSYSVEVIERDQNLGLALSITKAVTEVLERKEAVIVLEDDCVPEPGFITYMLTMLRTHHNNKNIGSICGYMYPGIAEKAEPFFSINRFCPWGWATWRDRWAGFSLNLREVVSQTEYLKKDISELGKDIHDYCNDDRFLDSKMDIWSLNWILRQFSKDMKIVYPKHSLINNIGFDGTGVHSVETNAFEVHYDLETTQEMSHVLDNEALFSIVDIDSGVESQIIKFLEKNSKMTYILDLSKG